MKSLQQRINYTGPDPLSLLKHVAHQTCDCRDVAQVWVACVWGLAHDAARMAQAQAFLGSLPKTHRLRPLARILECREVVTVESSDGYIYFAMNCPPWPDYEYPYDFDTPWEAYYVRRSLPKPIALEAVHAFDDFDRYRYYGPALIAAPSQYEVVLLYIRDYIRDQTSAKTKRLAPSHHDFGDDGYDCQVVYSPWPSHPSLPVDTPYAGYATQEGIHSTAAYIVDDQERRYLGVSCSQWVKADGYFTYDENRYRDACVVYEDVCLPLDFLDGQTVPYARVRLTYGQMRQWAWGGTYPPEVAAQMQDRDWTSDTWLEASLPL